MYTYGLFERFVFFLNCWSMIYCLYFFFNARLCIRRSNIENDWHFSMWSNRNFLQQTFLVCIFVIFLRKHKLAPLAIYRKHCRLQFHYWMASFDSCTFIRKLSKLNIFLREIKNFVRKSQTNLVATTKKIWTMFSEAPKKKLYIQYIV